MELIFVCKVEIIDGAVCKNKLAVFCDLMSEKLSKPLFGSCVCLSCGKVLRVLFCLL